MDEQLWMFGLEYNSVETKKHGEWLCENGHRIMGIVLFSIGKGRCSECKGLLTEVVVADG